MITSLRNERVKLAHALLSQANARRKEQKIALEGVRLVSDAIERGRCAPEFVLHDPSQGPIPPAISPFADRVLEVGPEVIRHVSATERPQGLVGVFPMPTAMLPKRTERLLILDGLRDPGNVGGLLRTAAAAGVDAALCGPGCVDVFNDKVLRSAMGAHFRMPVLEMSWEEIGRAVGRRPVYLADLAGDQAYDAVDWTTPHALIIGGEADGSSDDARRLATRRVHIPMAAATESLNAAVAAGVILFEAARQWREHRKVH